MIRINLLPVKETEQAEAQRREIARVGIVLLLLVVCFVAARFVQGRRIAALEAEIAEHEQALTALDVKVKDVADLDQKRRALDAKLKVIADLGRKRVGPVGVLEDLARATPDRVWLTDFNEVAGSATISGQAVDNQILAEFLRALSASAYFTTVDLVETTQDQAGELKLRKFILKAQINYAAERKTAATSPPAKAEEGAAR